MNTTKSKFQISKAFEVMRVEGWWSEIKVERREPKDDKLIANIINPNPSSFYPF
jgi:hypothetical protein